MDVGGRGGSHHFGTLSKLVARGFVESERFVKPWGSFHKRYRITALGVDQLGIRADP